MKSFKFSLFILFALMGSIVFAQEGETPQPERKPGHTNLNKFRQLSDLWATPNMYRTASGAPGPAYYQNTADYKMKIELKKRIM